MKTKVRAVIADEWSVLRGGVSVVLAGCNVEAVAQTASASAALAELDAGGRELLVLGSVSDQSVTGAVSRAKAIAPGVRVIVLLADADRSTVLALLDGGADAVLLREASEQELHDAVERVNRGERFIAPGLLAGLFGDRADDARPQSDSHLLTDRERRVLGLLVEGRSNREIASHLYIGEATVKTHLNHLYRKLKVANRVQAVGRAIEMRLLF